mmetsp:Transcript_7927/g.16986  ORF Transcript_7927/g.16986 Transcript_7927/m.16986 type:complete len:165 (+) Transcript_7927:226-720(+)
MMKSGGGMMDEEGGAVRMATERTGRSRFREVLTNSRMARKYRSAAPSPRRPRARREGRAKDASLVVDEVFGSRQGSKHLGLPWEIEDEVDEAAFCCHQNPPVFSRNASMAGRTQRKSAEDKRSAVAGVEFDAVASPSRNEILAFVPPTDTEVTEQAAKNKKSSC